MLYDIAGKSSPVVFIIRGESGSGKHTFAKWLADLMQAFDIESNVVSAAMFMGEVFDRKMLGIVHSKAQDACRSTPLSTPLILCNTATKAEDLARYLPALEKRIQLHVVLTASSARDVFTSSHAAYHTVKRQWLDLQECKLPSNTMFLDARPLLPSPSTMASYCMDYRRNALFPVKAAVSFSVSPSPSSSRDNVYKRRRSPTPPPVTTSTRETRGKELKRVQQSPPENNDATVFDLSDEEDDLSQFRDIKATPRASSQLSKPKCVSCQIIVWCVMNAGSVHSLYRSEEEAESVAQHLSSSEGGGDLPIVSGPHSVSI